MVSTYVHESIQKLICWSQNYHTTYSLDIYLQHSINALSESPVILVSQEGKSVKTVIKNEDEDVDKRMANSIYKTNLPHLALFVAAGEGF